jgi:hypothetical protein
MKTLMSIVSSTLHALFGWGPASEVRVSPAHGWLLPAPSRVRLAQGQRADRLDGRATPRG